MVTKDLSKKGQAKSKAKKLREKVVQQKSEAKK